MGGEGGEAGFQGRAGEVGEEAEDVLRGEFLWEERGVECKCTQRNVIEIKLEINKSSHCPVPLHVPEEFILDFLL